MDSNQKAMENSSLKFMGNPCKKGHSGERYIKGGICCECSRLKSKTYYYNKDNWIRQAKRVFRARRTKARSYGVPFTITFDQLGPPPATCPVLGIEMGWRKGYKGRDHSPSMDRIDSSLGYIPGNVVWVSFKANRIKSDATADELRLIADYYKRGACVIH